MDALKSAGRAIIRSPSIAKQSWASGRHKKLPENWTDTRETLLEGMVFQLKYLGVTLVEQPKGEELSAAAVKRIVATAKASGKKLQKVILKVSPRGIILYDSTSNQLIENVSIYRISYCTADKMHDKVFAYIAQSQRNETLECHAFLCAKKKVAQAVTLTVAQAFKVAFEFWQNAKEGRHKGYAYFNETARPNGHASFTEAGRHKGHASFNETVRPYGYASFTETGRHKGHASFNETVGPYGHASFTETGRHKGHASFNETVGPYEKEKRVKSDSVGPSNSQSQNSESVEAGEVATGNLLNLEEGAVIHSGCDDTTQSISTENNNIVWELDDGLDEAFSRLAECRANPQVLDTGLNPQDYNAEECLSPCNWDKADGEDGFGF
ncbi:hypothetical protein QTP70_015276 [Hemibagrus guttatus]|uniref:PID domain-containing protein n=1 Tax=Hemibagrus guttatus TaxID=175788 RepID=A0AAE0RGI4_9TELE|nr:hypothetical protein QTP70_015276 [Hemibagrus guttatus]KAK3573536.1 hypothetical protein QTP86_026985 [Hemibagrus guttatus]